MRENAVAIITPEFVPEFKVHVEGKLDYVIVKTMFPSLTVQQIGCKDEVILRTNNQEHSIGIVDTDADFNHSQISDLDRCTDTGQYCCMFAAISFPSIFRTELQLIRECGFSCGTEILSQFIFKVTSRICCSRRSMSSFME